MEDLDESLENHYRRAGLFEDIIERLIEQGIDVNNVKRADIAGVDEFHVRGASVSQELAGSIELNGAHVLDVGCGLGGPCRMLAEEFDCTCTGIDLSHDYIRTASELSKLVKLDDRTTFIQGNALNLPFDNENFDLVWTQHVQMNIRDKVKFYSEITRVLKPGGHFLYYDIFKKGKRPVNYPMPWATTADQSFLIEANDIKQILYDLGFSKVFEMDQTNAGIEFFEALMAKLREFEPPKMGLNVVMGDTTKTKLMNLFNFLKEGSLTLQSGAYLKL